MIPPEALTSLPGSLATTLTWRHQGQAYLTVITKATFAFAVDAPMPRTEPQAIVQAEVHHARNPGRSIQLTSDLVPALARADVLFTGCAHPPRGSAGRSLPVRLGIFAHQRALLDKRLVVQDLGGTDRVPLTYERALRGADDTENPFGLAKADGQPSIIDPANPERPAGFGPIGRAVPARKRLLGALSPRALEGPLAEIPEGFSWSYFQAAPPDQRTDLLRGDEWILLEGLHPDFPLFRTRLPGARGVARIHGLSAFGMGEGQAFELYADTLRIDGAEQRVTVVWRRNFPLAEAALGVVKVVAGVELDGEAIVWPEPAVGLPKAAALAPAGASPLEVTVALTDALEKELRHAAPLPFVPAIEAAPRPPAEPPSPWAASPQAFPGGLASAAPARAPGATPSPPPPPPLVAPAPVGVLEASNAALGAVAARPEATGAPVPEEAAGPARLIDLLWFDPKSLPRVRRHPAWRAIVSDLEDQPPDPDIDDPELDLSPAAAEERREIFEVLAKGEPTGFEALRGALPAAVRPDGRFVAPLLLVEGELVFPFDEIETLRALIAVVGPLGGEARLKATLVAGGEFLATVGPLSSRRAAEKLSAAIREAYAAGKRDLPVAEVEEQVEHGLLEQRCYQRRAVLGGPMLRCLLRPAGSEAPVPAYLPEALATTLPMFQRFSARVIAEAHPAVDQRETPRMALRGVALARLITAGGG